MVTERVEGEKRSARHNSAMCSSAAHAREAGGGMAARCTGCWYARTVERELPPVAERHGGSSRTAAAAGCQRAGGYGADLGTLAAAAAALVMARGGWTAREAKSLRRECGWSKIPSSRVRALCSSRTLVSEPASGGCYQLTHCAPPWLHAPLAARPSACGLRLLLPRGDPEVRCRVRASAVL